MHNAIKLEEMDLYELKTFAKEIGVSVQGNLSEEKLRARIEAKLTEGNADEALLEEAKETQDIPQGELTEAERLKLIRLHLKHIQFPTENELKKRKIREASRYVRIVVHVNNENKKKWKGQWYSVGNSVVPPQKKFVPFENGTGWHVQRILYNHLKEEKYQQFYTVFDKKGNEETRSRLAPSYTIEVLPPITAEEFEAIQRRQLSDNTE